MAPSSLTKLSTIRKSLSSFKGQRDIHEVLQLSKANALPAPSSVFSISKDENTQQSIKTITIAASEGQEVKKTQLGYVSNVLASWLASSNFQRPGAVTNMRKRVHVRTVVRDKVHCSCATT